MKTLTLYQPWASLLAHGIKTIETRSWSTRHRGWLLIHAANTTDKGYLEWLVHKLEFQDWIGALPYPNGVILAKAFLTDCQLITMDNKPKELERMLGNYRIGRYQWVFGAIERFAEPIPAKGKQRLWEFEFHAENTTL